MLSRSERNIFLYSITVTSKPDQLGNEKFDLLELLKLLQTKSEGIGCIRKWSNERKVLIISDMTLDDREDYADILFTYGDKECVDPAFINHDTKEVRRVVKKPCEGGAVSAHLVISLRETDQGSYIAALEGVDSLSRTVVSDMLNQEFKVLKTKRLPVDGKYVTCFPSVLFSSLPSKRLRDALKTGRLTGIELVDSSPVEIDVDVEKALLVEKRELIIRPKANGVAVVGDYAFELLRRVGLYASTRKFDRMVVHFSNDGRPREARIPTSCPSYEEWSLTYCEQINDFEMDLEQSYSCIRSDVTLRMKGILKPHVDSACADR